MAEPEFTAVVLIGGPYDGWRGDIKRPPSRLPDSIAVGTSGGRELVIYERLDDPDTGQFLGAYVRPAPSATIWTNDRRNYDRFTLGKARP